jgi:hypothetical protein
MLTIDKLKEIERGARFASGLAKDYHNELHMNGTGIMLRWVAVKGYGYDDWAIYAHDAFYDEAYVARFGNKVSSERNIKFCVPCDDEVFARYRY